MNSYVVSATVAKGHKKQLTIPRKGKKSLFIMTPRYSCVGKGDRIRIDPCHHDKLYSISSENPDDYIKISPHFETITTILMGKWKIKTKITEVNSRNEVEAIEFLEQYHYKTNPLLYAPEENSQGEYNKSATKSVGGRKAILVAYFLLNKKWIAAGYIDLQMPLMMCKPRHELFNNPFQHSSRPIEWSEWKRREVKRYVNLIVRIARVVVGPEYRGLGLSRSLVDAAIDFCKTRWQVNGRRPIFLEISAEMLNYIDFVSSSKFRYVGKTEGNLQRVVVDLSHMMKNYKISSGIMSLQKKYFRSIERYCHETGKTFDEALERLSTVIASEDPMKMLTPTEWAAFRSVLRMPIPYYLYPLDGDAIKYLDKFLPIKHVTRDTCMFSVPDTRIAIKNLQVTSKYHLPQTNNVRLIMETFGLNGSTIHSELVRSMEIKASSGNIIMIVGSSGSGKTVLLRALDPMQSMSDSEIQIRYKGKMQYTAAWLETIPDAISIFDYFASTYSPERAFSALSQTGLSEAVLLVKPFFMLSKGQRYRAMLADLLLRDDQVWLLDEFCADLDPITAKIVAHNFRRNVMRTNRIAFIASANHGHYIDALRPTSVIFLHAGGSATTMSYKDYRNELFTETF